jgi:hypothetical protein
VGEGQSGNPGGRPKVLAELRDLARRHAPAAVRELARLAVKAKNEGARVAAIKELLDRGYGKAGPLVPGFDDVLAERHPGHGGTVTIEFVRPREEPEVVEGTPPSEVDGSRH